MELTKLPAVATNFNTHCTKCDAERYFKVLTHKTATSAQIQCEVCKAKKTFKLTAAKKTKSGKPPVVRKTAKVRADAHRDLFETLRGQNSGKSIKPYTVRSKFETGIAIEHPKFGIGYIQTSLPEKIEVVFEEAVRFLVHNR